MNYTKHQITRETKAAEIYKGDSIKQNIRAINYQTRKGVRKAPLPGLSAYRDCRMGNNAMLYDQLIVNKRQFPIPSGIKGRSRQIEVISG